MRVRKGFTLVELSLSLVFIAVLSLTIALVINNTVLTYRRGLTLNQINTTGMDIVDDMRAAIQNSSTKPVTSECLTYLENSADQQNCEKDGAVGFVSVNRKANVYIIDGTSQKDVGKVPVFGVFCTGTYSYIWNSGYFFDNSKYSVNVGMASLKYGNNNTLISNFRLLKFRDDSRAVCAKAVGGGYDMKGDILNGATVFDMGDDFVLDEEPIDLLATATQESAGGLAIYDLVAAPPAEGGAMSSLFYAVSFILGTVQGGVNVNTTGNFCATPNDYGIENFDYCAINKFNFAVQATGE